jgi:hypothetical protein
MTSTLHSAIIVTLHSQLRLVETGHELQCVNTCIRFLGNGASAEAPYWLRQCALPENETLPENKTLLPRSNLCLRQSGSARN